MTQPHPSSNDSYPDDEIDLFELLQTLWGYKWLIAGISAIVTALGVGYAFSITPIFEAESQLVAPRAIDVQEFQALEVLYAFSMTSSSEVESRQAAPKANFEYTPAQVYARFQANLQATTVRRLFFYERVDAAIKRNPEHTDFEHFNENFNTLLSIDVAPRTLVAIASEDPQQAAQWVNEFVDFVATVTVAELVAEAKQSIASSVRQIEQQLSSSLTIMRNQRFDRIAQLQEALIIAQAMNLEDPMIENAANQLNMEYMRGGRALAAEIAMLRNRESDESFVVEFRDLQQRVELLNNITLKPSLIQVMRVDQTAEVPTSRKSPNRALIAAVSIVLGGMMGMFAALILGAIRKRQQAQ